MGRNDPELAEIIKGFLREYPKIPSRRIARWVTEKHPQYDSVERVRTMVRYYRGTVGGGHRKEAASGEFFEQAYDLPIPTTYDSSEFKIDAKCVLALSDIHAPFHDLRAIETSITWGLDYSKNHQKIDAILLNGDGMDMYQLSPFVRDPRQRDVAGEVDDFKDFLGMLKDEFGVPIYFKYGNHEDRFETYIYTHAKEFANLKQFTLDALLDLEKYNCTTIKDKRVIKIGHLNVIHGHEFKGGIIGPVNPARTFFLRAKAATMGGHHHLTSEHSGRTIDGKLITCWSTGCLCHLKPKYMPMNEWNHGFSLIRNDADTFRVLNLRIENGVVY